MKNRTGPTNRTQSTLELMAGADQLAITKHPPAVINTSPTHSNANANLIAPSAPSKKSQQRKINN
jgi:hypothetical protein